MKRSSVIDEIVKKICDLVEQGEINPENLQTDNLKGFEKAKNKAEGIQQYRDANDETYRSYIWSLLNNLLDENSDYRTSEDTLVYISPEDKAIIIERVYGVYRGLGILDTILLDENITEVMINGPDNIFIEKSGRVAKIEQKIAKNTEEGIVQLRKIVHRIVDMCGREVNEASPIVDARLKDGSRVNIVLHPIAMNGDTVTIRKFSKKPMSIEKLISYGSITNAIAGKLQMLIC